MPFLLIIILLLDVLFFPIYGAAGKEAKGFLKNYPYYILLADNTWLNRLLFKLFSKENNKVPFIYYSKIAYILILVLQIPAYFIIYYFKLKATAYFWVVLLIRFIPYILFFIMIYILEQKEKIYKNKK